MHYDKYPNIAYNLHLINTDKFKTVHIKINFKRKLEKKEITYRNLLSEMLMQATKNYPTSRLIEIAVEDRYNMGCSSNSYLSGNYHIISFGCNFLNEKYTEEGMSEKSLQFLLDFIFNPNADNHKFDEHTFKLAYNILKQDIETYEDIPTRYAKTRLLEEMEPDTPISYRPVGYMEDLEEITSESLYQYYQSVLKSDLVDIFIIGNLDNTKMKKIIDQNFNIKTLKKPGSTHFTTYQNRMKSRAKTVKESKNLNQSSLIMAYKTEEITPFERQYVAPIYSYILGGGPDSRLFQNIREKNSLCYSVSSSYNGLNKILLISAGINAKDFNKTTRLIKEQVRKLNRGEFDETDIEKAKTTFLASLKEITDSPAAILNIYVAKEYLGYDTIENRKKNIKKVTKEMVLSFAKKLHIDTVFFLEGSKTNEKDSTR